MGVQRLEIFTVFKQSVLNTINLKDINLFVDKCSDYLLNVMSIIIFYI
jgi:hypothetical protein